MHASYVVTNVFGSAILLYSTSELARAFVRWLILLIKI